jgi:signal transduction histidine kinase
LTNVRDLPPLAWLDANASLQVLRILQEALTNVVKHAQASRIRVETAFDDDSVVVRVTDRSRPPGSDKRSREPDGPGPAEHAAAG